MLRWRHSLSHLLVLRIFEEEVELLPARQARAWARLALTTRSPLLGVEEVIAHLHYLLHVSDVRD